MNPPSTSSSHAVLARGDLKRVAKAIESGEELSTLAAELDLDSAKKLLESVAQSMGMPFADLESVEVDATLLDSFPLRLIHRFEVFPIQQDDEGLTVAISNPVSYTHLTLPTTPYV